MYSRFAFIFTFLRPWKLPYRSIFAVACLLLTFQINLPAQNSSKPPDKRKDFGKSLKRFEERSKSTQPKQKPKTETSSDEDVITVATDLVVTDVLVVNEKGNAIVGLKKEDFVVTENGVPQEVELFAPADEASIPRMIVLIIEVGGIPSLAEQSLEAAKSLVDRLRPIDKMAIADTDVRLRVDFTSDKTLLKSTLQSLKRESKAGRHEYSTLMSVLAELFSAADKRPIVIQQSFGGELSFMRPAWDSEERKRVCKRIKEFCERNFSLADVREAVARSRATIYTVVPGPQVVGLSRDRQVAGSQDYIDRFLNEAPIRRLSEKERAEVYAKYRETNIKEMSLTQSAIVEISGLAGGYTSFLETPADAAPIYDGIFKVIENRYTLGFYPKDKKPSGSMNQYKIQVRGRPDLIVIGRGTYFTP